MCKAISEALTVVGVVAFTGFSSIKRKALQKEKKNRSLDAQSFIGVSMAFEGVAQCKTQFSFHFMLVKTVNLYLGKSGIKHRIVPKLSKGRTVLSTQIHLTKTMPLYRDSQTFIAKIIRSCLQADIRESV